VIKPEQECDQGRWSAPEYVDVEPIVVVEDGRLPINEGVVKDIMATIGGGDVSALPPIHLWRKQPGADLILVAGRNRLEAHRRSGWNVIEARVITGETPQIIRAVQLVEIEENLNRRKLSPALRRLLTKQRKALYEEKFPETKRGSAGGRAKAGKSAKSQNANKQTPAFIDAHAKQTGQHRATIAREISEAEKIGDATMKKIVDTSLDKQGEITALAAMDEHERQEIVDRAVAGEKVSAAKAQRKANIGGDDADAPASAPPVRYPNRFTSTKQPAKRGRAPGVPNILTSSMKDAIVQAAEQIGAVPIDKRKELADRGDADNPLCGYFKIMAVENAKSFAYLLGKVLPMHVMVSRRGDFYTDQEARAQLRSVGLPEAVLEFIKPVDLRTIDLEPDLYPDPEAEDADMLDVTPDKQATE
jgi:hypothetical protein